MTLAIRQSLNAWIRLLGVMGVWALVLGCAAGRGYDQARLGLSQPRHVIQGLEAFEQAQGQCGAAALATVLDWSGRDASPQGLAPLVYDPERQGSLQVSLASAARRYGRLAYEIHGQAELLAEVTAGHPVIVLQNLGLSWYPVHHYSVAYGFDLPQGRVMLLTGRNTPEDQKISVFDTTWARSGRWGLVVLPPEEPPARPEKGRYLQALLGLEQAGRFQDAALGFETFLNLWPQDQTAFLGLGNSRYQSGDLQEAADVLSRAVQIHPDSAPLQNNLAHVLMELGCLDKALSAARKAVSLGGPHLQASTTTLNRITTMQSEGQQDWQQAGQSRQGRADDAKRKD